MAQRLVFISDTHNKLNQFAIPDGDILIHCGDATGRGSEKEMFKFFDHFAKLPHKNRIYVPGNHDFFCESFPSVAKQECTQRGIILLDNASVTIEGINFYGIPDTPWFMDWAFNRSPAQLEAICSQIPPDTNILVTHGPPHGILDFVSNKWTPDKHVGCKSLLQRVIEVKPKIHAFGHIHGSYGMDIQYDTKFLNCSNLNEDYEYQNPPWVIYYERKVI